MHTAHRSRGLAARQAATWLWAETAYYRVCVLCENSRVLETGDSADHLS